MSNAEELTPELMLAFYRRLYPFKSIFGWLNHELDPTKLFRHREFAFTLAGDVYLRYNSFENAEDLKKQVLALNPTRFEIGPVYSARPRDKKTIIPASNFKPVLRELVFDIDMTDYDSIRTCCSDAGICRRCWNFISVAVRVLDQGIRDQFGYKHLLWVYSGRRGIHLWISDKEAMELTDDERKALVGWMTVIQGGKDVNKKVNVRTGSNSLPPSLQLALETLRTAFSEFVLPDQDPFHSTEGWEALLQLIPHAETVKKLRDDWSDEPYSTSEERWDDFKRIIQRQEKGSRLRKTLEYAAEDIAIQYTYPRLDAEVSKHRNHLLKAPFCVHPKTSRVCVPVDPANIERFDPGRVPTVGQLLGELDKAVADASDKEGQDGGEHRSDWEKTSLKPYIDILDKHVAGIMAETRRAKREMDTTW